MAETRARLITTMAIALAMASIASVARAQSVEFRRGLSAFNRAEYAVALENWAPRARAGEPESQSGLGFLYYKGLGVPQDSATAFEWYSRAADQGQPEAQLFVGSLYLFGDGVPRDLVKAYAWCEISQSSGAAGGLECRDEAQRRMSPDEVAAAIKITADWYARAH